MKKMRLAGVLMVLLVLMTAGTAVQAQCSICTRTAQQLGERPAKSLNAGIMYLAAAPLMLMGVIGYRWWRSNEAGEEEA